MLPSSDNDDLGESDFRRNGRRFRRRGHLVTEDRLSKYEQFHFSLCALIIALVLALALLILGLELNGVPTFLYL